VSIHSLLALCALGFLQSDLTLALAALQELSKHGGDKSTQYDVTVLQCLGYVAQVGRKYIVSHLELPSAIFLY